MLKKVMNKLKRDSGYFARLNYLKFYDECPIDEKAILLESQHGTALNGNVFYLLKELCQNKKYNDFRIYLSVNRKHKQKYINILS